MNDNIPPVSIDPLFQNNLKSRLEQHIAYIHNLQTNPPKVSTNINRLARLISYGLPAVAIGVIVFLVLPYRPTPTITDNIIPAPILQQQTLQDTNTIESPLSPPTLQDTLPTSQDPTPASVRSLVPSTPQPSVQTTPTPASQSPENAPMLMRTSVPTIA
jgi:hypothetical protein